MGKRNIKILDQFKNQIVPLKMEEFIQLEKNILKNGCLDPLIVWARGKDSVLLDGHHRLSICRKHNIQFNVMELRFRNVSEAGTWMINHQIGRRNLTADQMSYYRGLKYLSLRKKRGGYDNVQSKGQNEPSTSEIIAREFKISKSTIKRDARFALGLDIVGKYNPKLKQKILLGETNVSKGDLQLLSQSGKNLKIKNEADLYNKAKIIKREQMIESKKLEEEQKALKVNKARELLAATEPVFMSKENKLIKLKGRIVSTLNQIIKNKDISAIKALRKLIDTLEKEFLL